jgi:hypothetical protein
MPDISKIIATPISLISKLGPVQKSAMTGIFRSQYTIPSSTKVVTYEDNRLKVDGSTSTFNATEATQLIFDLSDSSNSGHPFTLATANDESTNYANVTSSGTPGNIGATLTTTLPAYSNNQTLWWYCSNGLHSSEGASFAITEAEGASVVDIGEYGNVQGASTSRLWQGNQGTTLKEYTIDLSSSDYADASLTNGNTGHVFVRYESGTSYRNDPQLYQVDFDDAGWVKVGQSSGGTWGYGQWKTTVVTTNQAYNHAASWATVAPGSSPRGKWHRDTGNTPSGGTGVSVDYHIYYEGSSGAYSKDVYLRSPEFTFTTNTIKLRMYGYGSNMGSMYLGIYVTGP